MTARGHVLANVRIWRCPSCGLRHDAPAVGIQTKTHQCPNLSGLDVPLVDCTATGGKLTQATRHVAVERQDYLGSTVGARFDHEGRPISAIRTERGDGSNDVAVLAPTARPIITPL